MKTNEELKKEELEAAIAKQVEKNSLEQKEAVTPEMVTEEEMRMYTLRNPHKLKEVQHLMMTSPMSDATKVKPNKSATLTYLPWAPAWEECIKFYPQATYKIKKNTNHAKMYGLPVFGNSHMGFMCFTEVTIEGITREMWLPVMDNKNNSMLKPTTFAINKTVMRCLVKNLAMFGLGMYIFKGEDLPSIDDIDGKGTAIDNKPVIEQTINEEPKLTKLQEEALDLISRAGIRESQALELAGVATVEELVAGKGYDKMKAALDKKIAKNKEKDEAVKKAKEDKDKGQGSGDNSGEGQETPVLTPVQIEVKELLETAKGVNVKKALAVAKVEKIEEIVAGEDANNLIDMLKKYIAKKVKK